MFSKLDRAMVNDEWNLLFPSSAAHIMLEGLFDHSPIIINAYPPYERIKRPFKYFTM